MGSHEADEGTLYKVIHRDGDRLICRWEISYSSPEARARPEDLVRCSGPGLDTLIDLTAIMIKEIVNLKTLPRSFFYYQQDFFGGKYDEHTKEPVSEEVLLYVQKEHRKRRQKLIKDLPVEAGDKKLLGLKFKGFQYPTEDLDLERLVEENRVELKEKTPIHLVVRYRNRISLCPLAGLNIGEY